ncbi:MAG: uroporphyrinogen-III C-methyltransferase [Xanthobacteraceae bacterium]|nr:uroporphyrinogen-III C-methyltransferase [Xanthobacteraceae bacterium]
MNPLEALTALHDKFPVLEPGHVWLAGAGPGDPGMLTLDALAGLAQADVIVHDALVGERVLALAGPRATLEFAGKRGGRPSTQQTDITARLIELARDNKRVLRLKGGDPCVFGRGGEEAIALADAGIPFRLIPGITAGLAGLAAASIPATMRGVNQAISFVTGHADPDFDWTALARTGQPIVIYMAMRNVEPIVQALTRGGLAAATPAAVIVAATLPEQHVVITRLDHLAAEVRKLGFTMPGLIVIGEIVKVRDRLLRLAAQAGAPR